MYKKFKIIIKIVALGLLFWLGLATNPCRADNPSGSNKYAWQASLETIRFMPLLNADSASGVIVSDWYNVQPNIRYKIDIYVLDGLLTASSVHVSLFKQKLVHDKWQYQPVSGSVVDSLERAILNHAKQLHDLDIHR